jgi:putative ABC transport system substrate-binding protein
MKRREFITVLGSTAAAWPLTTRAQQPAQLRGVGMLIGYSENDPEHGPPLGVPTGACWKEGVNVRIDYRFAPASVAT